MKLYLAHPLDMRKEIREIELEIERTVGIELANPFYDNPESNRDDIKEMDKGTKTRWDKDLDYNDIVAKDLQHIYTCDGMLAYIEKRPMIGTMFEIWHCYKVFGKPVYVVSPDSTMHPWVRHVVEKSGGKSFLSWEDFTDYMFKLLECEPHV